MFWRLAAACCFALIAVLSLLPGPKAGGVDVGITSTGFVEHLLIYGLLGFAVCQGFSRAKGVGLLLGVCVLGIGFEWIQGEYLQRSSNAYDILANIAGMAVGTAVAAGARLLGKHEAQEK